MIVADCSALVAVTYVVNVRPEVLQAFSAAESMAAPDYLLIEFLSATRRLMNSRMIDGDSAQLGLRYLRSLPFHEFDTAGIASEIWNLRNNFSVYDAGYVALAQILDAPLLTCDQRMKSAVAAHTRVRLI